MVLTSCPTDYPEDWDLDLLLAEIQGYFPTQFSKDDLSQAGSQAQLIESIVTEALAVYEARDEQLLGGAETARLIEREVMLQIIDQRWRDHLSEMDYLREGINLRAMGQQDPLVAWQREGFDMFTALMGGVDDDYLRYVMHVQSAPTESEAPSFDNVVYEAADDPVADVASAQSALAAAAGVAVDQIQVAPQLKASVSAAALAELGSRLADASGYLRIEEARARKVELEEQAAEPGLWDDQDRARQVTTELGRVSDDLAQFDTLASGVDDAGVLLEMVSEAASEGEPDASLETELAATVTGLERSLSRLELQSLFQGDYDESDAIAEFHAGAGGTDAQDWCEMMLRMVSRWAERRGFSVELDEATEGQEAGLLSATAIIKGRFAFGLLSAERGVHRLVRMSPFDSQHRRQTSFASLEVTPFMEELSNDVEIDEKDLRIDTYRASGAGGQHINKTDSAVRLTHLPSGIVVSCQNERSQHQNKARAMQILSAKLAERARAEREAELSAITGDRRDNAWGNQIRSYVMAPYQLVKDLRTNVETGNVDAVLDGDLDDFMEAELRRRREAQA